MNSTTCRGSNAMTTGVVTEAVTSSSSRLNLGGTYLRVAVCTDVCIDMCIDMQTEISIRERHRRTCKLEVNMNAGVCIGMHIDICIDMCIGVFIDVRIDECRQVKRHLLKTCAGQEY